MKLAVEVTGTENLFETLANKSPVGLYIVQDGRFYYTNPTFQTNTGYREDELLGRDSLELVVPEDRERVRENAINMLKGELTLPYQFRVTNKDGSIKWVLESVVSIQYRGRPATLGTFIDITERKRAEETLQAEKNKLQSLVDALEYGLTIQDKDCNIIYQNTALRRIFGDYLGKKCYRVYEGKDKLCGGCPVKKAFEDGKPHTSERRVVIPSGEVTFWENTANPIKDAGGRIVSCLEVTRDITERKRMEEALRDSEEKLRKMFDSISEGISVIDLKGSITEVNQRTVEMHGFNSKDELRGKSALELVAPCDHERVAADIKKIMKQEATRQIECTLRRADGSEFPGELSTNVLKDASGNLVGHITIARDITEPKKQEQALADELTRRRLLIDQSLDGIVVLGVDAKVVEANQRFAEMLGYTLEEVQELHTWDWDKQFPPEKLLEMGRGIDEKGLRLETRHTRKDGSLIDVDISISTAMLGGQKLIFCVCRDITERKKQEQALRDSEERYRELADSITDVFFAMDEHLRYTYWNKASEALTGILAEDAIGKSLLEVFPDTPETRKAEKVYRKVLRTQQSQTFLNEFDIDGRHYTFEISAYPSRVGISIFVRDITERKKMEESLKQAAEEWRKTFDSINDGVSIHDRDFRIQRANRAFADIFDMKPSQIIGRYCYELHKGQNPRSGCPHEQSLATGKPAAAEFYESHLGKHLHESTSPIFDEKGDVVATVHVTRDITEQKQQNERLMMTDRLASIGELASGAAHELNNPLTSIIGFSQLLMEKEVPEDIREDLKLINNEAQRAAAVTNNLLAFARKRAPTKQLNQINNIIEDVLQLRAHEHKVNHIDVDRHLAPNLPEIKVDYFQMQQVFMNIIINAEYFMIKAHNGGTLTITTKKQNSNVRISIADDGPGIPPENLGRVFDPFFTTKEAGKGTGLGLSICHGIVTEHGGQIHATSQLGKGTTIIIDIPIKNPTHFKSLL
ncbi:MAG: PAS domain S-box protein [Chloroflexota bacterium]